MLPALNKKVVYLDQFAISELFKTKTKTRRAGAPREAFWKDCWDLANRAYLRQQVVFPSSNIHSDETIVFHSPSELRLAHEMLSGDVSFRATHDVATEHEQIFAEAFLAGQPPPSIVFDVDEILDGDRNVWLSKFHIDVKMDLSIFASGIRSDRESANLSLDRLAKRWAREKLSFDSVLRYELESYGASVRGAITSAITEFQRVLASDDPEGMLHLKTGWIDRYHALVYLFEQHGVPSDIAKTEVVRFLDWPGNHQQPTHRISAYLFAALAWKISSGQRAELRSSILNDINAISTYGPYVDAMFVDRECAALLKEGRLRTEVRLKAKMFSLATGDEFLQYLKDLVDGTPADVRSYADRIYGLS
ncbi:hypothetical protein [Bradyrhizobium japonicum]|uniref:Uncharacterized protein n=1 Tax=Bradyrhizobium japonicum TaxID=375 RepID=A0A1Y2J7H2_BRAJP|nr:hypothetical protein [Bradyrhizobium japonicum]OSJ22071.1 hypothetical protein BSZ19_46570 [Bradyrhizobium japonicum]